MQSALWRLLQQIGIPWLTFDVVQVAANVVLFIPLGLLVALILPRERMWLVAPGALLLTLAIELAQAALLPVRWGLDLGDIIANTCGGLIGLGIAYAVRRKPRRH